MHGEQLDPKFQRAMEFAKNFKQKHRGTSISNMYVIQAIDRDGNVVDEKYGMNLMTNYGMTQYFVTASSAFPTNLYIGNGSGTFNHTTNTLLSPITTTAASIKSTTKSYAYPVYYDPIEGIVTTVVKYIDVYFNYSVTGIDGPVDISEYGIGTAHNLLWTHSWVYNSAGQKDTVRKDLNTRLDITVYMCMSFSTSLIEDAWAEGKCICITNPSRFFNRSGVTMNESNLYTFRRFDYYDRTKTHTTGYADNVQTITSNMGAFTLLPPDMSDTSANVYVDGFISWNAGLNMMERGFMPTPIAFDRVGKPDSTYIDRPDGFTFAFGATGCNIPFTQADITASYTYNYKTGQYTCPDHFVNDARKWYNEMSFDLNFATTARFTNNNEVVDIKLFRNLNTEDPIIAIDSANTTVYATDTYWSTASWVRIEDLSAVPAAVQNKRYWLTTDDVAISPVRGLPYFEFLASDGVTHAPTLQFRAADYTMAYKRSTFDRGPQKKWFVLGNRIYIAARGDLVVQSTGPYAIGYNNLVMHYDREGTATSFYQTDVTELPTPTPVQVSTTGSLNFRYAHITESENGYAIAAASNNSNITLKFDLTGASIVQTQLTNTIDAICIPRSQYYAYIEDANPRRIFVKKLSDDTTIKQLDLRSDYAAPIFLFGWRNYLYITDTANYVYLYDISQDVLTELDTLIPGSAYNRSNRGSSNDHAFMATSNNGLVLYKGAMNNGYDDTFIITYDNPTVIHSLAGMTDGGLGSKKNACIDLIDVNTDSLLMVRQCTTSSSSTYYSAFVATDIGKYIREQVVEGIYKGGNNRYPFALFGEFYVCDNRTFHVGNLMHHRLVGTTRCITTANGQKNISNKRWTLSVTNLGGYSGLPPGTRQ